ncbi:MAG: trehalose-6-phosphate synthase [Candidatus Riflebacteria bacterium]|nr:trehalose-6-phosphate synthase [Candidatus Riflebacteria bacterium]
MKHAIRFGLILLAVLGGLTWTATVLVGRTARNWFERDVALRAQLAMSGARSSLVLGWKNGERSAVQSLLSELTKDDRLTAAAAYGPDLLMFASTAEFPAALLREGLGKQAREAVEAPASQWAPWHARVELPAGRLQASAFPIFAAENPLGYVILLHNLDYIDRRATQVKLILLAAFALLSLAASVATVLAARLTWRESIATFRRVLQGEKPAPELRPLLHDMQELVDRIRSEEETDSGGLWTPQRLKQVLHSKLQGERVLIVANREPYIHQREPGGAVVVQHPASGLVTALEPVMRACSGTWIGHGSGSADRETCDAGARLRVPPGEESYFIRRVWLTAEEEKGYYYGFSNEGLWPLCHVAHQRPTFRSEDWQFYQSVNLKFAKVVLEEADSDSPVVLVQDYHFALAPRFIRQRLPKATLLTFWHIPWPDAERIGICPWRRELLEGMLGSSILGFHTRAHCNNFLDAVDRYLEARIDREEIAVVYQGHTTAVRPYPISIEWPSHWARSTPPARECRASIVADLKLAPDVLLGVGVDRLDYTKGIEERLLAVGRLLERHPEMRGRFTFIQLAAPSRTFIDAYRLLGERVEALAQQLNEKFGQPGYRPVVLARSHHEPAAVFRYYRAADLCYVSSLHDGMNLVAKEFAAARDDERGVLLLSQFTGASREMTGALVVNPYDLDEASDAMFAALTMDPAEQRARMRSMRLFLSEFNVYRWAGRMLVDAARLRRRERLAGRLDEHSAWEAKRLA